jgi:hypothetical protein
VPEPEPPARRKRASRSRTPRAAANVEAAPVDLQPDDEPTEIIPEDEAPVPRTGVEIVDSTERDGVVYHSMRDLRNLKVVQNVTRDSARRLWRYAITQKEKHPCDEGDVTWSGERGFWKAYKPRGGDVRFNLAVKDDNGALRVFYGVTEEGMDSDWRELIPEKHRSSGS